MRKIILSFMVLLIVAACSAPPKEESSFEITGKEKEKIIGQYTDRFLEPINRDNITGFHEMLGGKFENFSTSRYNFEAYSGGLLLVYDEEDNLIFKEVMDHGNFLVELDLWEDYTVEISGFRELYVMQVGTNPSQELFSGIWQVGLDIEAGNYTMTGEGHGYVQIFDANNQTQVFEVIGNDYVNTRSDVVLKEGQKIRINGLSKVDFE